MVISSFSLFIEFQVNVKNTGSFNVVCGFLSHLHHAGAVAVLFSLAEESSTLAFSSKATYRPPQECVRTCVRVCVFALGNDAAPVCVNFSATELKQK